MIDTHCHLNDFERIPETRAYIDEALEAGVKAMIVIGTDLESSRAAVKLADDHPEIFAVVGHHPTSTGFSNAHLREYEAMFAHPKVVAIGEVGLDFHWDFTTVNEQEVAFQAQLELAASLGAPVVIHCREAYQAITPFIHRYPALQFDFHCFGGSYDDAQRLGERHFFGVDGPVTFKKSDDLRALVSQIPRSQWLLETDAPWLAPHPYRGKSNRSAWLPLIAQEVAQCWDCTLNEVDEITTANALRLFSKLTLS